MAGDLNWISGKRGFVKIRSYTANGDEQYTWFPFGDWSLAMHADFVKRNVFRLDSVQGYQDGVSGFKSGKVSFKGPWTEDAAPISVGGIYDALLGITSDGPLEYGVTFHATDLTPSVAAEDGPMMDVSGDSVGVFDSATIGDEGGLPDT